MKNIYFAFSIIAFPHKIALSDAYAAAVFTLAAVEAMLDRNFRRWIEESFSVHNDHALSVS